MKAILIYIVAYFSFFVWLFFCVSAKAAIIVFLSVTVTSMLGLIILLWGDFKKERMQKL